MTWKEDINQIFMTALFVFLALALILTIAGFIKNAQSGPQDPDLFQEADGTVTTVPISRAHDRCVSEGYEGVTGPFYDLKCFNYTREQKIAQGIQ